MTEKKINPIRPTDAEAIRLAKTLMRTARFGALAVLDPSGGSPLATRVATATDHDGTPVLLVSELAQHTRALAADPRCSILLGEPGKGDPLAHPRITVVCRAVPVNRGTADHERIEARFLRRHPKAGLYAGFGDFGYRRLEITGAALNGGFGQAYNLTAGDLLVGSPALAAIAEIEQQATDLLNSRHREILPDLAKGKSAGNKRWRVTGIDCEGIDFTSGENFQRFFFKRVLTKSLHLDDGGLQLINEIKSN